MAQKPLIVALAVAGIALATAGAWWIQNRGAPAVAAVGSPAARAPAASAPTPVAARGAGGASMPSVEVARVESVRLQDDAQAVGT
ncbi:MAG: efflux transporter periplasmic adaptor subunit, partial [Hydrogenophaga sp.]|nr:efflux transporter periplasmic adaptor subunit [Hydrogenophaga sp.]